MSLPDNIEESHKMIEDLRKENADRRVKLKTYDEAFSKFNETERDYLIDLVARTGNDPKEGAKGFRDLAFRVLDEDPEQFLDGLDIEIPTVEKETVTPEKETESESDTMTPEQMQKILDERDEKAAEAARKAEEDAEIESVFAEIEALGFERNSPAFLAILNMGGALASSGEFDGFDSLAPKVKKAFDIEEAQAEAAEAPAEPEPEPEGSGKPHVSTAEAGGSAGAPTEPVKNWIEEAKEQGRDVMQVARERAEARIYD